MLLQFSSLETGVTDVIAVGSWRYPLGVGAWIRPRNGIPRQENAKKREAHPKLGASRVGLQLFTLNLTTAASIQLVQFDLLSDKRGYDSFYCLILPAE